MALECNNCGAPVRAPAGDAGFAACTYCGAAVALPPRRAPKNHSQSAHVAPSPVSQVTHKGFLSLPVIFGVVVAGVSLVVVTVKNLAGWFGATQGEDAPGATKPAEDLANSEASPDSTTTVEPTSDAKAEAAASRSGRGEPRRGTKGAATAPSPSASAAPAQPVPPEPPPEPKVARASIGGVTVTTGSYPLAEIKTRLRSITAAVQSCYAQHLRDKPDESGTLDMGFSISGGRVRGAGATNPLFSGNLVPCVNRAFNTMSFENDAGVTQVRCVVTLSSKP
jgi:hypothetical protein